MCSHQQRHLRLSTLVPSAEWHATVTPPCLRPPLLWLQQRYFSASPSSPTCDTFGALGPLLMEELVNVLKTNQRVTQAHRTRTLRKPSHHTPEPQKAHRMRPETWQGGPGPALSVDTPRLTRLAPPGPSQGHSLHPGHQASPHEHPEASILPGFSLLKTPF